MSETIDVQKYLQAFLGEVPQGIEGDRQMRERVAVPFMDTTDEDVRRDRLQPTEINSWLDYAAWNLWDFILGRASEGESGLIPRQEYETISFVQQWNTYPRFLRMLTDELGVDGLHGLASGPGRSHQLLPGPARPRSQDHAAGAARPAAHQPVPRLQAPGCLGQSDPEPAHDRPAAKMAVMMKIFVDWDLCESHGQCEFAAPEVFSINDDGDLELLDESPPEAQRELVEQAVRRCPTRALTLAAD